MNMKMILLMLAVLILQFILAVCNHIDCGSLNTCIDCVLRSECGWQSSLQLCGIAENENVDILEGPGCPEYEPVAIVSLDTNEEVSYTITYDLCSKDFDTSIYSLQDVEWYEFDMNGADSENCQRQSSDATFYVKSSDDSTMTYELYGKVTSVNGDSTESGNNKACNILITHGAITSMTCAISTADGSFNDDGQATTLYGILKFLLPRMDYELFDNNNNNILDEDSKGKVLSTRSCMNESNETINMGGGTATIDRTFDFESFDYWQPDVIPLYLNHYDSVSIDNNNDNNHIISGILEESFIFELNNIALSLYSVNIELSMINQIDITDATTVFEDLYNELYVVSSNEYGYATVTITSHNWHKGQFSDSDYNLNIDYSGVAAGNEDGDRRRTLYIEEIYAFNENLFTSPSIFGVVFSGDVDGSVGIDCIWHFKSGNTLTNVINDQIPVCPSEIITCAFNQASISAISLSDVFDIISCCESLYVDLGNCDETQLVAENDVISCINSKSSVCSGEMVTWIDDHFWDSIGAFVFLKDKYCSIDCVAGGNRGIIGHATLRLNVNGNTLWSITFNFDESSEFDDDTTFDIFEISIPVYAGISVNIKFEAFLEWGLNYDEFNDGSDYVEKATPYFKAGITVKASLGFDVVIVSAEIGIAGSFTLIDFEYPIEARLVGFNANPLAIPDITLTHEGHWNDISFEWWIFWEVCFLLFCESGTIDRRRNLLLLSSYNNKDDSINNRMLLASYSESAHDGTIANLNIGGYWILDSSDIVYDVNSQICFTIYANDDLSDYIGFSDTLGNAMESIGMTKYWLTEYLILQADWSLLFLESAQISVTPNTNAQSSNLGCDNGLPYEVYVLSTMCLTLNVVVRSLDDFYGIQARFSNELSQEYFLEAFSDLILASGSPYNEYIDDINTDAATSVVSHSVTLVSSEYYNLPTKDPTSQPTMAPTIFGSIVKCNNSPCSCAELSPNCNICHNGQGCDECKSGYFKKSYNHKCQSCVGTFGVGCISCQDFNGCGLCKSGYERLYDASTGVWYCQEHGSTFIDDDWKFDRNPTCQCPYQCRKADKCSCAELEHCSICHESSGCDECDAGYFKKDYNTPCLSCVGTFGASCMSCSDFIGCQQCISGYTRQYDASCKLYYCKKN